MARRLTVLSLSVIAANVMALGISFADGPRKSAALRPIADLQRECKSGYFFTCADLGIRYRYGDGAPRDEAVAFEYFRTACDGGLIFACGYAGDMLCGGFVGRKDCAEGERLLRDACEAGDAWSCTAQRRHKMRLTAASPDLRD